MAVYNTTTPILRVLNTFSSSSGTYTHYSTDWIIVDKDTGKVVWESLDNQVALETITVPPGKLKENTDYVVYSRFRGVDATGTIFDYSPYGVYELSIGSVQIAPPVVNATGAPNQLPSDPEITTNDMVVLVGTDSHFATDWYVETLDGNIVFQSPTDSVNKTSIKLPEGTLLPQTTYVFKIRHIGSNGSSPFTEVLFTTQAKALAAPDVDIEGEPDAIDNAPRFLASPFDMIIGTDTHQSTLWEVLDDADQVVFSRTENATLAGNPGLNTLDLNPLGVALNWDTVYKIRVTYYGVTVQATTVKQFRVMREPLAIQTPTITVEGEATNEIMTNPQLTTTPFTSNYNADTPTNTEWRIFLASDVDANGDPLPGATPIYSATVTQAPFTTHTPPLKTLDPNTSYTIQVKNRGTVLVDGVQVNAESQWGSKTITTANITLSDPIVYVDGTTPATPTYVVGDNINNEIVSTSPTLTINPPPADTPAGSSPHQATSWQIWLLDQYGNKQGQPVWSNLNNSQDLLSTVVPDGILSIGTNNYYVVEVTAHGSVVDSNTVSVRFKPNLSIADPVFTPPGGTKVNTNKPSITIGPISVTPSSTTLANTQLEVKVYNGNDQLYETHIFTNVVNNSSTVNVGSGTGQNSANEPGYGETIKLVAVFSGNYNSAFVSSNPGVATYPVPGVSVEDPNLRLDASVNDDPATLPKSPVFLIDPFTVIPQQNLANYVNSVFTVEQLDNAGNYNTIYNETVVLPVVTSNSSVVIDTAKLPNWSVLDRGFQYRFSIYHNATKDSGATPITSPVSSLTGTVPHITISPPALTYYWAGTNRFVDINTAPNPDVYYIVPDAIDVTASNFKTTPDGVPHERTTWYIEVLNADGTTTMTQIGVSGDSSGNFTLTKAFGVAVGGYAGEVIRVVAVYESEGYEASSADNVNDKWARISNLTAPTLGSLYTSNSDGTGFVSINTTNNVPVSDIWVGVNGRLEATPSGSDVYRTPNTHRVTVGSTSADVSVVTRGSISAVPISAILPGGALAYNTTYDNIYVVAYGASGRESTSSNVDTFTTEQEPTVGTVSLSITNRDGLPGLTGQDGNATFSNGGSPVSISITGAQNVTTATVKLTRVGFSNQTIWTNNNVNLSGGSATINIYLPIVLSANNGYTFRATVTDNNNSANSSSSLDVQGTAVDIAQLNLVNPVNNSPAEPVDPTYTVKGPGVNTAPTSNVSLWTVEDELTLTPNSGATVTETFVHTDITISGDVSKAATNTLVYNTTYSYRAASRGLYYNGNLTVSAGTQSAIWSFTTVPRTNVWVELSKTILSDLPDDIYSHTAIMVGGEIFIGGGQGVSGNDNSPPLVDANGVETTSQSALNAMFKGVTPSTSNATEREHQYGRFYRETATATQDLRLPNSTKQALARLPEYNSTGDSVVDGFLYMVGGVAEVLGSNGVDIYVMSKMYYTPVGVKSAFQTDGNINYANRAAWREKVLSRPCYSGAAAGETSLKWWHLGGFVSLAPLDNTSYSGNNQAADSATALQLNTTLNGQSVEYPILFNYDRNSGNITNYYVNSSSGTNISYIGFPNRLINIAEHGMVLVGSGIFVIIGGMALYENSTVAVKNDRVFLLDVNGTTPRLYYGPQIPGSLLNAGSSLRSYVSFCKPEYLGGDTIVLNTTHPDGYVVYAQSSAFTPGGFNNSGNIAINWYKGLNRTDPSNNSGGGLGTTSESSYGAFGVMMQDLIATGAIKELYFAGGINPSAPTFNTKLALAKYIPNQLDSNGNLDTTGLVQI